MVGHQTETGRRGCIARYCKPNLGKLSLIRCARKASSGMPTRSRRATPRSSTCEAGCDVEAAIRQRVPLSRLPASVRRAMDQQRVSSGETVRLNGPNEVYTRTSKAGTRINHYFCPTCGVTVCWTRETGSTRLGHLTIRHSPPHRYLFGKKHDTSGRLPWTMWIIGTRNRLFPEVPFRGLAHRFGQTAE